jgi:predicted transcriptional regulator
MQKIEESKTKGLANLQSTLQTLIDTNIKKYKKLQNLSNELTQQKTYVIGQYQNDLNTYLNTSLQNRYNRNQYLALKAEVNAFKAKFYTATNQLNCSNILSTTTESTGLSTKITTMSIAVNS